MAYGLGFRVFGALQLRVCLNLPTSSVGKEAERGVCGANAKLGKEIRYQ